MRLKISKSRMNTPNFNIYFELQCVIFDNVFKAHAYYYCNQIYNDQTRKSKIRKSPNSCDI